MRLTSSSSLVSLGLELQRAAGTRVNRVAVERRPLWGDRHTTHVDRRMCGDWHRSRATHCGVTLPDGSAPCGRHDRPGGPINPGGSIARPGEAVETCGHVVRGRPLSTTIAMAPAPHRPAPASAFPRLAHTGMDVGSLASPQRSQPAPTASDQRSTSRSGGRGVVTTSAEIVIVIGVSSAYFEYETVQSFHGITRTTTSLGRADQRGVGALAGVASGVLYPASQGAGHAL